MPGTPFIVIGSKGTSVPTDLTDLEAPLRIGLNGVAVNGINWAKGAHAAVARKAHAWVSEAKRNDWFQLWPLTEAVSRNLVVHVPKITWRSNQGSFTGEAFFPAEWKQGEPQPLYVAVRAKGWNHGCVERDRNAGNRGRWVGHFDFKSIPLSKSKPKPTDWSHDEHILAFNLYCKIPFGRQHSRAPEVIDLAKVLHRSANSVALKLNNFSRLDPELQARGIKGMAHGAKGEVEVWREFEDDPAALAFESERLLAKYTSRKLEDIAEIDERELPKEGIERERLVRVRVNQHFFRAAVLAAYDYKCCITGLAVPELLVASHIVPWAADPKQRMNPRNGLCLNALHDRAFDRGLMFMDDELKIRFRSLKGRTSVGIDWLLSYEGKSICQPRKFPPDVALLTEHRGLAIAR